MFCKRDQKACPTKHVSNCEASHLSVACICVCGAAGKRKLLRSNRDMIVIGGSLLLWGAVITVIYGTSIHTLDEVRQPLEGKGFQSIMRALVSANPGDTAQLTPAQGLIH